jgi:hypothetical protein
VNFSTLKGIGIHIMAGSEKAVCHEIFETMESGNVSARHRPDKARI